MKRTLDMLLLVAIFSLGVILAVSQSVFSQDEDPSKSVSRHLPELVSMELLRLGTFPDETGTGISRDSSLGKKILGALAITKEKKSSGDEIILNELKQFLLKPENRLALTEKEYKTLLAKLRVANAVLRGKNPKTALNELIAQELKQLLKVAPDGTITLPNSLREKLKDDFKEIIGSDMPEKIPAADLQRVLEEKGFEKLTEKEKTALLGESRLQAYDQKGDARVTDFDHDLREDLRGRLRTAGLPESVINQSLGGNNPLRRTFEDFFPRQNPNGEEAANPVPALPNPRGAGANTPGTNENGLAQPRTARSNGHNPNRDFPTFGGAGRSPGVGGGSSAVPPRRMSVGQGGSSENIAVPSGLFTDKPGLNSAEPNENALLQRLRGQKTSLLVTIDGSSACQMTLHKATNTGNGTCKFIASSAKHCFSGSRPSLSIEGFPEGDIAQGDSVVRASASGGDLVAINFTANRPCESYSQLPVIDVAPPSTFSNLEGRGVILASRWGANRGITNLGGRVSNQIPDGLDSASGSVLQVDVRDSANGGMGVFPGDSGGGAFISVTDGNGQERLQMIGVLSKKIEGAEFSNGIGFIASRSDTAWLANLVGAGNVHNTELARHNSGGTGITQTHFDSVN